MTGQPTDDELTALRLALLRVARRLRQEHAGGLTPSQLSALATIERSGPLSLRALAELERVQPPSITRIGGALEGEGWVERVAGDADRRVAVVRATDKARNELERIRQERNAWLAGRLATLTVSDRNAVMRAVPAIEKLLEEQP